MMTKPFLLLSTRASDQAVAGERAAVARGLGWPERAVVQYRLERDPLPANFCLDDWSGILVGGSDFCASNPDKPAAQQQAEAGLTRLLTEVLARDFPFLGLCYGVGLVTAFSGGVVDDTYSEAVGAIPIHITEAGRADPLLADLPDPFYAYVGHKEAARQLPPGALLLATGDGCPVQMFRLGRNVYATQFHPELDTAGLIERMHIYAHDGYFDPADFDRLAAAAEASAVDGSQEMVLRRFAERYGR
jgi:GMP synthase (glutamine-hydrolysing)